MLELLYDLPDAASEGPSEFVIDREAVQNPRTLAQLRVPRKESA